MDSRRNWSEKTGKSWRRDPFLWLETLVNPRVWHLACIGFGHGFATYTFSFWLPQIMKSVLSRAV